MSEGRVKWFSAAKGYGFIDGGSQGDIFVHFSVIQKEGYRTLKEGQLVTYEAEPGPKGLHATNVALASPMEFGGRVAPQGVA